MSDASVNSPFDVGDSVRVKDGVEDSDYPGEEIGGRQGRVVGIANDERFLLEVEWDSITLEEMPKSVLREAVSNNPFCSEVILSGAKQAISDC